LNKPNGQVKTNSFGLLYFGYPLQLIQLLAVSTVELSFAVFGQISTDFYKQFSMDCLVAYVAIPDNSVQEGLLFNVDEPGALRNKEKQA